MTLSILSLLVVLILSLFSFSIDEQKGSQQFKSSIDTHHLKQSAINLVISQIRQASSRPNSTWASQPGALRSYGSNGDFVGYKLYTDEAMVYTGTTADESSFIQTIPSNWYQNAYAAHFVDLNAPVLVQEMQNGTAVMRPKFPIIDPRLLGQVEGFDYVDPNPGTEEDGVVKISPTATGLERDKARLAMPVRWLYMLRDGTVGLLNDDGIFSSAHGILATADNPIVGRIAFWADDESAKINLNTASEGSFWDSPRGVGVTEKKILAAAPPARNEFSRYPGHPATVSLSVPFKHWMNASTSGLEQEPTGFASSGQLTQYANAIEPFFGLSPRINFGGSRGGTRTTTDNASGSQITMSGYFVSPKSHALYSTTDELLFNRQILISRDQKRTLNPLSLEAVEVSDFITTTDSSSPDTNPFDQPKISVWPQLVNVAQRGTMEHLLAMSAQFGIRKTPYYFQRLNGWTSLNDSSANSPTKDYLNITRNQQLYQYLTRMGAEIIPGYGSSFTAKYGQQNVNQIFTQIFDYIRSSVSKGESTSNQVVYSQNYVAPLVIEETKGFGQFLTLTEAALVFHVISSKIPNPNAPSEQTWSHHQPPKDDTQSTIQAFLVLETYDVGASIQGASHHQSFRINGLDTVAVNGRSLAFPASAMVSMFTEVNRYSINRKFPFKGLGEMFARNPGGSASEGALKIPLNKAGVNASVAQGNDHANYYSFVSLGNVNVTGRTMTLGSGDLELQILPRRDGSPGLNQDVVQTIRLRFPTATVPVPYHGSAYATNTTPTASNAQNDDDNSLYRRFEKMWNYPNSGTSGANWGAHFASRFQLTRKGDTIRAIEVLSSHPEHRGDVRLIAARKEVPVTWFEPEARYTQPSVEQVHSLSSATWGYEIYQNQGMMGDFASMGFASQPPTPANPAATAPTAKLNSSTPDPRLVLGSISASVPVNDFHRMTVPSMMRGGVALNRENRPGDWDTGITIQPDGPYINPVDDNMGGTNNDQHYWAGGWNYGAVGAQAAYNFSPNRQITSPVKFGSLPTGVYPTGRSGMDPQANLARPWQTLLFAPNPAARRNQAPASDFNTQGNYQAPSEDHYGFKNPPDHLFLEFFHMPAVEPYPMSEPGATSGRINMNHQLAPFDTITRTTGLRAALKSVRVSAISPDQAKHQANLGSYKYGTGIARFGEYAGEIRYRVNADETLRGFELMRFQQKRLFRYPSEICTIFIVPERIPGANYRNSADTAGLKYENMPNWWSGLANSPLITGDNLREQPYSALYPLLTTKSNTYTVHYRVQALRQDRSSLSEGKWDETKGRVLTDNRGQVTLERYLNHDADIPDFAVSTSTGSQTPKLSDHMQFRILRDRRFVP